MIQTRIFKPLPQNFHLMFVSKHCLNRLPNTPYDRKSGQTAVTKKRNEKGKTKS